MENKTDYIGSQKQWEDSVNADYERKEREVEEYNNNMHKEYYKSMENKTDKPYSHKQAKKDIAKKYGYESWFDINFYQVDSNNVTTKAPYSEEVLRDEAAELYASKATEELRKERDDLKIELSNYAYQIDRAKRDRDIAEQKVEELRKENEVMKGQLEFYRSETQKLREYLEVNRIGKSNQKLFDALYEEIERLKESNKALEQNRLADDIQMHDLYAKIRTLEESQQRTGRG